MNILWSSTFQRLKLHWVERNCYCSGEKVCNVKFDSRVDGWVGPLWSKGNPSIVQVWGSSLRSQAQHPLCDPYTPLYRLVEALLGRCGGKIGPRWGFWRDWRGGPKGAKSEQTAIYEGPVGVWSEATHHVSSHVAFYVHFKTATDVGFTMSPAQCYY